MARYIDADKLLKWVNDRYLNMDTVGINQVKNFVNEQPTADVKKVVRGRWLERYDCFECSKCGAQHFFLVKNVTSNFCPDCGADMREEKRQ